MNHGESNVSRTGPSDGELAGNVTFNGHNERKFLEATPSFNVSYDVYVF